MGKKAREYSNPRPSEGGTYLLVGLKTVLINGSHWISPAHFFLNLSDFAAFWPKCESDSSILELAG